MYFSTNMSLLRFTYRYMVVDFHTLRVRKVRRCCKKNKKGPMHFFFFFSLMSSKTCFFPSVHWFPFNSSRWQSYTTRSMLNTVHHSRLLTSQRGRQNTLFKSSLSCINIQVIGFHFIISSLFSAFFSFS